MQHKCRNSSPAATPDGPIVGTARVARMLGITRQAVDYLRETRVLVASRPTPCRPKDPWHYQRESVLVEAERRRGRCELMLVPKRLVPAVSVLIEAEAER